MVTADGRLSLANGAYRSSKLRCRGRLAEVAAIVADRRGGGHVVFEVCSSPAVAPFGRETVGQYISDNHGMQ